MTDSPCMAKKTGIRHLAAAAGYSTGGARRLIQEAAARHEIAAYCTAMLFFALIGARPAHYLVLTALFLILLAVEALNTAVEEIVDHISRDYSSAARNAKDLGSFAVLCLLGVNAVFVIYVAAQLLIQHG